MPAAASSEWATFVATRPRPPRRRRRARIPRDDDYLVEFLAGVIARLDAELGWRARAACRGMSTAIFFRATPSPKALRTCAGCPVADECRTYADSSAITKGVWGGLTGAERRRRLLLRDVSVL